MTLDKLVEAVKRAVDLALLAPPQTPGLRLQVAELQLSVQTELVKSAGVGFTLEVLGLGARASASKVRGQTLSLNLVPDPRFTLEGLDALATLESDLSHAVATLRSALEAALSTPPAYKASRIAATLQFTVTASGEISLIFSAGASGRGVHTVTVVLEQG